MHMCYLEQISLHGFHTLIYKEQKYSVTSHSNTDLQRRVDLKIFLIPKSNIMFTGLMTSGLH